MRRIGFIMEDGSQVMGMAALTAFEFANDALGEEMYRLTVMSEKGGTIRSSLGIRIETEPLTDFPDTLIVVEDSFLSLRLRDCLPISAMLRSSRVAGVCTGAFLLAEAGLLDGRTATTHWAHGRTLRERYPAVAVDEDRVFVHEDNIWTSAGMSAAID